MEERRPQAKGRRGVAGRAAAVSLALILAACGSTPPPVPGSSVPTDAGASAAASPAASGVLATAAPASPSLITPPPFPLALVGQLTDKRVGLSLAGVRTVIEKGTVLIPCGLTSIELSGQPLAVPAASCVPAKEIAARVKATKNALGLLPPGLVTPRVKALQVGGADLFGSASIRAKAYPLTATSDELSASSTAYDAGDIRTLVSTGDTCPDRSVSYQANVLKKGWDWTLNGGTARYTGIRMDRAFDGPDGNGWPVVDAVRSGHAGAMHQLLADADITINDFECPMVTSYVQHEHGTVFSIDPKVAGALARAGVDVVTLGSNHITDQGQTGVRQTLSYLDKAGVKHAGAGMTIGQALAPAVVDVRGVRFAFIGWDDTGGSAAATATSGGAAAMTEANIRSSSAAARTAADVVVAMPQWNWPEYHAGFTSEALRLRNLMYAAGVDHILGAGTHWAGAFSLTSGKNGDHLAVTSHGNFLFGQDWSRQTEEGVIVESTFRGTRLVQVRLHPYIVLDGAQPNLTDPRTDGAYVLDQIFEVSRIP